MLDKKFNQLEQTIQFMLEVEKLKNVYRKTKPVGLDRFENSAEHSWHVCLSALMLKEFADESINIDRVIKMLLIHDLGEIDVGDKIIYESESEANKLAERNGVKRILDLLDKEQSDFYLKLWDEFESGESADAKYAKAIDRIPPLLHNIKGNYKSWTAHNISQEQVLSINSRIGKASESLWQYLEREIKQVFDS